MITIDMKMPTDCSSCLIRKIMGCKIANESGWLNNRRDERCMLKELVQCKNCQYGGNEQEGFIPCEHDIGTFNSIIHEPNWFCADGRKKEDVQLLEYADKDTAYYANQEVLRPLT